MLDEAGFDGIVCFDHMIYPREPSSPYPDSPTGKPPWPPETARPLLEVIKQVATASVVSDGRVSLAVGVGWMREEFELMGQHFGNGGKRLDEMIPALRELWRGGCRGPAGTTGCRR